MCSHHLADQGYKYIVLNLPPETYELAELYLSQYKLSKHHFHQHFLLDFIVRVNPLMPIHTTYTGADAKKFRMWVEPKLFSQIEKRAESTSIRAFCYTALIHFLGKWQFSAITTRNALRKP